MRSLLMISNNNMALRELYTTVLDQHAAGWTTSFMSGMPTSPEQVVSPFDLVIYELGPADSADRVASAIRLKQGGAMVVTHVEGRSMMERQAELAAAGVHVISSPISAARINAMLDALVISLRARGLGRHRVGVRERFRRFLGG